MWCTRHPAPRCNRRRPPGMGGRPAPAPMPAFACAVVAACTLASAAQAFAAQRRVAPGTPLQPVIDAAAPGDTIRLAPGRHAGPIVIDRTLPPAGKPGARLAGTGSGSVVTVTAPDVRVHGLEISGSGIGLAAMDSAILVKESAPRADVRGNHLVDNLFGVYLHGAGGSIVRDNVIAGRRDLRMAEAGNGVSIWHAPGAEVIGNTISHGRAGIFVKVSTQNHIENNAFSDLRF